MFAACGGLPKELVASRIVFLLDSLLRDARSSCRGLCLASLDLSKAFDTVSHESITAAMRGVGLDRRFLCTFAVCTQSRIRSCSSPGNVRGPWWLNEASDREPAFSPPI
jgi:hypothetical protein